MEHSAPYGVTMSPLLLALSTIGCMKMHAIQVGEIDAKAVENGERFEIKLSAIGVSTEDLGDIAEKRSRSQESRDETAIVSDIIELTQMGPRTGEPVFNPQFADRLHREILRRCPSGRVTGLVTIRETADYPGITGEIVKAVGYCGGEQ